MALPTEPRILVVDDDLEIRKLLGRYLTEHGFRVTLASDRRSLLHALETNEIGLIVLDVMLPDGSGMDVCRDLRARNLRVPIILLTALREEIDRIVGLEVGADDYLGKPFNPRELVARIRAVLRRGSDIGPVPSDKRRYRFGGYELAAGTREVLDENGGKVDLTGAEFHLLHALVEKPGRILSREQLLALTRRESANPFDRSIDVLMSRIRRKLFGDGTVEIIKTVRNLGYILAVPVEPVEPAS